MPVCFVRSSRGPSVSHFFPDRRFRREIRFSSDGGERAVFAIRCRLRTVYLLDGHVKKRCRCETRVHVQSRLVARPRSVPIVCTIIAVPCANSPCFFVPERRYSKNRARRPGLYAVWTKNKNKKKRSRRFVYCPIDSSLSERLPGSISWCREACS